MTTTNPGTAYVAISRRTLDLEDYIDVARRHSAWILGPMFAGMVRLDSVGVDDSEYLCLGSRAADYSRSNLRKYRQNHG